MDHGFTSFPIGASRIARRLSLYNGRVLETWPETT